jgi:tetratricopeptide (TPR) repeat protein
MYRRIRRLRALQLAVRGDSLIETDRAAAELCYRQALDLDEDIPVAWFDLGRICLRSQRWEQAYDCFKRTIDLLGERSEEAAWWNLGVTATALRRWDVARRAWRSCGIELPADAGPIEADFGLAPVRLNPDQSGEIIVWGHRIDPARIRLVSVPFPVSGHRWADVILHDGVASGYEEHNGRRRPVVDEVMRWEASDVPTVEVRLVADTDDVDDLLRTVDRAGYAAEDWTRNVRLLFKRTREGSSTADEAVEARFASGEHHLVGIAGPLVEVGPIVRHWEEPPGRRCLAVDVRD